MQEVKKFEISYCTRVDKQRMGYDRPISVTFHEESDKDKLMSTKSKLPKGIYVNNEFLQYIKCNMDRLRQYRDKCRMKGDTLIINRVRCTVNNAGFYKAYKAAQKEDD